MQNKPFRLFRKLFLLTGFVWIVVLSGMVWAAGVTLQWDPNDPIPDGYRLYQRQSGFSYDYSAPVWTGTTTTSLIEGLTPGVTYYFVVRAFEGGDESGDSNEVQYTPAALPVSDVDSDGDGWSDALDAFPQDALEWLDTDNDGTGNNADEDDDGDGMPDAWEVRYGLNPLINDALGDLDGDGVSNLAEYTNGSDPSVCPDNSVPDQPLLSRPRNGAQGIGLTPTLMTEAFADPDSDGHARTCYQISTTSDFSSLVFERTYTQQLTSLRIPDLVLDPETVYYWRVRFYDQRNGASEWSDSFQFETLAYAAAGDADGNGVIDIQEVDPSTDIDGDGTADIFQSGLQGVVTPDPDNSSVAVKCVYHAQISGMLALELMDLPWSANRPDRLTGVISFRLLLLDEASTATVKVLFSQPAPVDAKWYKYDTDEGWTDYPYAEFSADRRSVTLVLEDGGIGDQDGVRNGIIVDPSGLGYSSQTADPSVYEPADAGGAGCFITASAPTDDWRLGGVCLLLSVLALIGYRRCLPTRSGDK